MNESVYIFKELKDGHYVDYESDLIQFSHTDFSDLNIEDFEYKFEYSNYKIPKNILTHLNQLLSYKEFNLSEYENDFIYFLAYSQVLFLELNQLYSDEVIKLYHEEDKEYENLFKIIEEYFFGDNKPHSISFKFHKNVKGVKTINNKIVISDIFDSICKNLQINPDNFYERKAEILESASHIKFEKGGEYAKQTIVVSLANFLKDHFGENISFNKILQFCGCFLHICQIPYSNTENEILITSIEDEFKSIEYQYIMHIYNKRKNLFS